MPKTRNDVTDAHAVLNSFRAIVKSLRVADRAGLREHGLGASQVYVLHQLALESPLSVNDLAERTATDQSTVSVVVAKLLDKGFVSRERAASDARRVELHLTAKGRQAVKKLPPPVQQTLVDGLERLPRRQARRIVESLREIERILGIDPTQPPMLFADEEKPARKAGSSKIKRD
ncbi:MAG TPA: MarR family winged helix-turn-helix transcriptional regulator [Thermoanaerobaculia bacterium]|jgi:DNA-binding MarR family transcriptional regulator